MIQGEWTKLASARETGDIQGALFEAQLIGLARLLRTAVDPEAPLAHRAHAIWSVPRLPESTLGAYDIARIAVTEGPLQSAAAEALVAIVQGSPNHPGLRHEAFPEPLLLQLCAAGIAISTAPQTPETQRADGLNLLFALGGACKTLPETQKTPLRALDATELCDPTDLDALFDALEVEPKQS
jgi:hypothetical protein